MTNLNQDLTTEINTEEINKKETNMELIYADLELVSAGDKELIRKGYLKESELKTENVRALVDTGAYMMCINEHIQSQLDLPFVRNTEAEVHIQ